MHHIENAQIVNYDYGFKNSLIIRKGLRGLCEKIQKSLIFLVIINISIVANIITLGINRFGITKEEVELLDWFDIYFFTIFWIEMGVELVVMGFGKLGYFSDNYRIYDCIVNVVGIVEVSLTFSRHSHNFHARGIIIILRLLRTFKLVSKWNSLKEMMSMLVKSIKDVFTFSLLLALFIFMYAIIGMEVFANELKLDDEDCISETGSSPRFNFDDFGHSILTVFTIFIGDNWSSIFIPYTRTNFAGAVAFFYTAVIVLNMFLMNLFLAILLQNFFVDNEKAQMEKEEMMNNKFQQQKMIEAQRREEQRQHEEKKGDLEKNEPEKYKKQRTLLIILKVFKTILSLSQMIKNKHKKDDDGKGIIQGNDLSQARDQV